MKRRRKPRRVTAFGKTMTVSEWSAETGIPESTLNNRLLYGYAPEEALSVRKMRVGLVAKTYEADGRRQTVDEWARELGVKPQSVRAAMCRGETLDEFYQRLTHGKTPATKIDLGVCTNDPATWDGSLSDIASDEGVTYQRAHQLMKGALEKMALRVVGMRVLDWEALTGNRLEDEWVAEIVALVHSDDAIKKALATERMDIAVLCNAALRLQNQAKQQENAA